MNKENRPTLFFFNISISLLWSIWYIFTTHGRVPRLIFLYGPAWPLPRSRFRICFDNFARTFFCTLSKLSNLIASVDLRGKDKKNIPAEVVPIDQIYRVAENTVATINRTAFIRFFSIEMFKAQEAAKDGYVSGLALTKNRTFPDVEFAYVLNGRWAPIHMFLQALQDRGTVKQLRYLEVIDSPTGKRIFESITHPWEIRTFYDLAKSAQDRNLVLTPTPFFEFRRKGLDKDGAKFAKSQTQRYNKAIDISLFTSSLEEQIGFNYSSKDAINLTKTALRELARFQLMGYRCALRLHPNTAFKHFRDQRVWQRWAAILNEIGVDVVPPESSVSSYDMIEASTVVLTIGSTIGAEAAYLGKIAFDFLETSLPVLCGCVTSYSRSTCINELSNIGQSPRPSEVAFDLFGFANYNIGTPIPKWLTLKN
ncbi:MAG: hypothetical protein ACM3VZ_11945 [Acidobacteriota bacterium]